jgi:hypothetical protein
VRSQSSPSPKLHLELLDFLQKLTPLVKILDFLVEQALRDAL